MFKFLKIALGLTAVTLLLSLIAANTFFALPERLGITESFTLAAPEGGQLALAVRAMSADHPDRSGIALLVDGAGAFAARALLAEAAQRSIDAQYYIWHNDFTGLFLLETLRDAANRGVRVRLLLDDNGISGLDPVLAALDDHPFIDVRLFNPFVLRRPKILNFAFDFFRLNRRMHNKSFTVDNSVAIVGGRNVGNGYFEAGSNPLYIDLDVLAVGDVVPAVSADFDRYWNSAAVYPASAIIRRSSSKESPFDAAFDKMSNQAEATTYRGVLRTSETVQRLVASDLPLHWAPVRLVSDDPNKALRRTPDEQLLFSELVARLGKPRSRLDLVSPYFVPGDSGADDLVAMAQEGVDIRIFTNSFLATDVTAVHAGYAKYRKRLLEAGIEILELKPIVTPGDRRSDMGIAGSRSASLHAKIFVVDATKLYVGSFNFDPRSMFLNTEMGFVIDSPTLARRMHRELSESAVLGGYRPVLNDGALVWYECRQGTWIKHNDEPGSSLLGRLAIRIVSWLPVQWLL